MAHYPIPMSADQQQPFGAEIQRSFSPAQRLSYGGPPFANMFDQPINSRRLPRPRADTQQTIKFLPPFLSLILSSTYFLVALCIILVVPILELVIGIVYINQCPINPKIPIYLIVTGGCGFAGVGLTMVIVISFICCVKQDSIAGSCINGCVIGIVLFTIALMSLFLFAWFIVGNVWVFGANNRVQHDNTQLNTYCHMTLYKFAFWIIIITYIMMAVSCCLSCCRACFQGISSLKA